MNKLSMWEQLCSFENLLLAYSKAKRGKSSKLEVSRFALNLEEELFTLQRSLLDTSYHPGKYKQFTLYERKPRIISVAPFRDRVIHHALMNVLEPVLESRFNEHSYACRKGKGVHKAVDFYQSMVQRYHYVLKVDIKSYFASIDHRILKEQLSCLGLDVNILSLLSTIIDSSPEPPSQAVFFEGDDLLTIANRPLGLPIGNLTSQWLANFYLNGLDHWAQKSCGAYIRYVDDMYFLSDSKSLLWGLSDQLKDKLSRLRLTLHPNKIHLFRSNERVDVLGYTISKHKRWLRNDNGWRFARKLAKYSVAYSKNQCEYSDIKPSIMSWLGHAQHAETLGLRKTLFNNVVFKREQKVGA